MRQEIQYLVEKDPVLDLDDSTLIQRIAQGDRSAFNTLYRRHYAKLARFILKTVRKAELVEEIVNDTMLVVWRKADTFEHRAQVSTWVIGIAYRLSLKKLEKVGREPQTLSVDETPIADIERLESGVEAKERRAMLRKAMEKLPDQQRTVVELTFFQGLNYKEIASVVGCPEGTVKTRMFHARAQLKKAMKTLDNRPSAQSSIERLKR